MEGPVAAAVGVDAVKHWTGRQEHRGQLSSAMTAKGTVSLGAQFADPHSVGVVGGTESARAWAARKAREEQPSVREREAKKIAQKVGENVRQRATAIAETFLDMDLNQHGSLSYSELRNGLDRIGVQLNNNEYQLLISQLDKNGDGYIEFEEFARTVKGDVRDFNEIPKMQSPVLDRNGHPVRVGMVMTTTDKNNSEQINQILQMPPANVDQKFSARESLDHSWVSTREQVMSEGSPNKVISSDVGTTSSTSSTTSTHAMEELCHVATRLKVRDTLTTKIGATMREQYLALNRDQNGDGVTVDSLHRTLVDYGAAVSKEEVIALLVTAGVATDDNVGTDSETNSGTNSGNDLSKQKIKFNDYKKLIHLTGMGDDVRAYDFARSVQVSAGVGQSAGGLRHADRSEASQDHALNLHVTKHLSQAAGGARSQMPAEFSPRKRVSKNSNEESAGTIAGIVTSNTLSIVEDDATLVGHDYGSLGTVSYLDGRHVGKHHNLQYRQHDHIKELGLMGGGIHASMGHDGALGEVDNSTHHGNMMFGGSRKHVIHGNHGDIIDHIAEEHLLSNHHSTSPVKRGSIRNQISTDNSIVPPEILKRDSSARKGEGGRGRGGARSLKQPQKSHSSRTTPRHLKADSWFRHDHHLKEMVGGAAERRRAAKKVGSAGAPPPAPSTGGPKVVRLAIRPPASPAARLAAEMKANRAAYKGAAGVSAFSHDTREIPGHSGRKHVPRVDNNLFKNMKYPTNK